MPVAQNGHFAQTSRALRRILRDVQRLEYQYPLDLNVQRLYRIADQVREALDEATRLESAMAPYPAYPMAPQPESE